MAHKLTASVGKQNAAFDKVYPELETLIETYLPPFFQGEAIDKLHSQEGRAWVVKLLDDALTAAEKVP